MFQFTKKVKSESIKDKYLLNQNKVEIMANNKIKYYPVNNGDTSLITLEDDSTILIDCNIDN